MLTAVALLSGTALYAATTIHRTIADRVAHLSFTTIDDGAAHTVRDYRGKVVLPMSPS